MRILHAPNNIANQAWYAAEGLRALGHEAEVWEYGESPFGFPSDRVIDIRNDDPTVMWKLFEEAIERFDVFHFHYGRSFVPFGIGGLPPYWDLPVLRLLGKKVFFTWHGHDCAIRRIHLERNPWSYFKYSNIPQDDDRVEKQIQTIRTYADEMFIVALDYIDFIPDAKWVPRIIDLREWPEQGPSIRDVPVVLHMPSRRGKKGTEFVLDGLRRLEEEGVKFETRLVEGVTHAEARTAIRDADVVVDNVITGDYEVVSMETMASSRVAIANLGERIRAAQPDTPVVSADPETFVHDLRRLLADRARMRDLASRGRAHVAKHHDAPVVAAQLVTWYEAPARAAAIRAIPDWISFGDQRKIEALEARVATLAVDKMRANKRAQELHAANLRLRGRSRTWKDMLPPGMRMSLRRARRKLGI